MSNCANWDSYNKQLKFFDTLNEFVVFHLHLCLYRHRVQSLNNVRVSTIEMNDLVVQ